MYAKLAILQCVASWQHLNAGEGHQANGLRALRTSDLPQCGTMTLKVSRIRDCFLFLHLSPEEVT
jgi:hypothetical protein